MKVLSIVVLSMLVLSCAKNGEDDCTVPELTTTCIDSSLIDSTALCTMEYDPVCGCDGVTYSNACVAASNGVASYEEGACCD